MKKIVKYKGDKFEIEVIREYPLFGMEKILFYNIYRLRDGYCVEESFSYDTSKVSDFMRELILQLKKGVYDELMEDECEELMEDECEELMEDECEE